MAAVTICSDFVAPKNKVYHCFHCSPIYLPWSDGTGCHDLVLWMLSFKPTFSLSSFTFIKRFFSSSSPSAIRVVSPASLESNIVRFAGRCCPCLCVTAVSLTAVPSQEALSLFSSNPAFLIPLPALSTDAQFSCHHSTGSRAPFPCFGLTGFFPGPWCPLQ